MKDSQKHRSIRKLIEKTLCKEKKKKKLQKIIYFVKRCGVSSSASKNSSSESLEFFIVFNNNLSDLFTLQFRSWLSCFRFLPDSKEKYISQVLLQKMLTNVKMYLKKILSDRSATILPTHIYTDTYRNFSNVSSYI